MLEVGSTFGRYVIRSLIGQGATAAVYECYQPNLDRTLALKVLSAKLTADPEFVSRFSFEARALARLDHPGIVRVYDAEQIEGSYTIAMQYVDGGTLQSRLTALGGRPMAPDQVATTVADVANALQYAHEFGVIHRDIKPSNILLSKTGRPLISDYGIAKLLTAADQTRIGSGIGTPAYMSPEQVVGEEATPRTDTYSLGIVAYEMLTGRVPFTAADPLQVMHAQAYDPPPRPSAFNPLLPPAVDAVFALALANRPQDRFATPTEFARALAERLGGVAWSQALPLSVDALPPVPPPTPAWSAAKPLPRRVFVLAGGGVLALVLLASGGFVAAQGGVDPALYSIGRATNLRSPSPSPVTTVHVAARLTSWIADWNQAVITATGDQVLRLPLDSWSEVTTLADRAGRPMPAGVTAAIADLQTATTNATSAPPATAAYYDAVREQRLKADSAVLQLRALAATYAGIPLANAVVVPARKVSITSQAAAPQLTDLPLSGYKVTIDQSDPDGSWHREFRPVNQTPTDYFWVSAYARVAPPATTPSTSPCRWTGTDAPSSTVEVTIDRIGDVSRACKFVIGNARVFTIDAWSRNVFLSAHSNPPVTLTDQTAVNLLVNILRAEIAHIDNVAPR